MSHTPYRSPVCSAKRRTHVVNELTANYLGLAKTILFGLGTDKVTWGQEPGGLLGSGRQRRADEANYEINFGP